MNNKFYIKTLGCRLNQAESTELCRMLSSGGWDETVRAEEADLIVVNSCIVTEKAEKETRQTITRLNRLNPKAKVIVAGCWADKLAFIGGIRPVGEYELLRNANKWKEIVKSEKLKVKSYNSKLKIVNPATNFRRYIKIQTGCSNNCSYCITKLVRGKPKSVPIIEVIEKVKLAVDSEVLEVVLTGVNISQYNDRGKDWIDLTRKILNQTKVKWLSFGSINPQIVEPLGINRRSSFKPKHLKLIKLYNGIGKDRLVKHLHLSLQSGSDRILRLMNRNYTAKQYYQVVRSLQKEIPGLNMTTDIIVGFPGESQKDFQKTVDLVKKLEFGKIHVFRYSDRPGTNAQKIAKKLEYVLEVEKQRRAKSLAKIGEDLQSEFYKSQLNMVVPAIIYGNKKGITSNNLPVMLEVSKGMQKYHIINAELTKLIGNKVIVHKVDDPIGSN